MMIFLLQLISNWSKRDKIESAA